MGLSSNILWHQTQKENLKKILKNKQFRYSYSLECIGYGDNELKMAFPMLSLCDIPIADISEYLLKYGGNSIGLSREWGIKNAITPVIYCEKTSALLNNIESIIANTKSKTIEDFFWIFLSHLKNHEGKLPKYKYKKYRFYDEREVRIIPKKEDLQKVGEEIALTENEYNNHKARNNDSSLLSNELTVSFDYSDIRYFILKDERSVNEIKEILSKEIDLGKSTICFFTITQIKEDFIGENHNEVIELEKNINDKFPPIATKIDIGKKKLQAVEI